jgi:hypothetical protein
MELLDFASMVNGTGFLQGYVNSLSDAQVAKLINQTIAIKKTVTASRLFGATIIGAGQTYNRLIGPQPRGRSTCIGWCGETGKDVLALSGFGLTIQDISFFGKPNKDSPIRANALIHCLPDPAYGPGIWTLRNLSLIGGKAGIIFGENENDGNCADMMLERIVFVDCESGIKVKNDQGMNYFCRGIWSNGRCRVFDFERGGGILLDGGYFVNSAPDEGDWSIDLGPGGPNNQISTFNNLGAEDSFAMRVGPYRRVSLNGHFCNMSTKRWALHVTASCLEISNSDIPLLNDSQIICDGDSESSCGIITFRNCSFNRYDNFDPKSEIEYIKWFKRYCRVGSKGMIRLRDCMIGWGTPIPNMDIF